MDVQHFICYTACGCLGCFFATSFAFFCSTSKTLPIHSSAFQSAKGKEGTASSKDGKSHFSGLVAGESSSLQQRQKRLQEHGKERRELLSKGTSQVLGNTVRLGSGGLAFSVVSYARWYDKCKCSS